MHSWCYWCNSLSLLPSYCAPWIWLFRREKKTALWQSGNSAFAIPQVPIIGNDNYTPIRRRSHISSTISKNKCVLSLTFALSGYLPIQLNCDYFGICCWGSKTMINNHWLSTCTYLASTVMITRLSTWLAQWCWKYFQEVQVRPPASWSPTSPLKTVKNQVCRKYLGLQVANSWSILLFLSSPTCWYVWYPAVFWYKDVL